MTPPSHLAKHLTKSQKTLAAAESCTGGLLGHMLTNIPGSSAWFKGGVIAYANEAKIALLGVPASLIKTHGAVSGSVVKAMAEGTRQRLKSDLAIATTGIAGPGGGTPQKPVGLVFIALSSSKGTTVQRHVFKGTRLNIKKQTVIKALNMIIKGTSVVPA